MVGRGSVDGPLEPFREGIRVELGREPRGSRTVDTTTIRCIRREIMATKRTRFTPQFRNEAVKMVLDGPRPIARVAAELGMNAGTLGNWVDRYREEHPVTEEPLTVSERIRLKELEAENRDLRMKNEFLGKAAAFFARESQ